MKAADLAVPGTALQSELADLAGQISALAAKLDSSAETAKTVHRIRTSAKKFRALLKLGGGGLSPSRRAMARDAVRAVKNSVASARDAQVMTERLRQISRSAKARHLDSDIPVLSSAVVQRHAARLERIAGKLSMARLSPGMLLRAFGESYARARREFLLCTADPADENLHEWRKHVKTLAYQAEALSPLCPVRPLLRKAKRLGSLLGDHHDFAVLGASLSTNSKKFGHLTHKINDRKTRLTGRCLRAGRVLFAPEPDRLAVRLGKAARLLRQSP